MKKRENPMPEHMRYRVLNLALLGCFVLLLIAFLLLNSKLGVTAARMPRVVGVFGLVLCAVEGIRQIRRLHKEPEADESFDKRVGRPAWVALLMMVAYIPLLYIFGFMLATMIFLFVTPFILGRKKLLGNAIYAVIGGVGMWACFVKVFSLRLPSGWLFSLIQ